MPLFPIISIAYHMKVRFYPHIYRLSRILYFQQVISPHQYKTKFGKRYEYKPREKYVCISRIKWKYVWEISNLHWTATEWCLQEILILKTEMACAPYWQFVSGLIEHTAPMGLLKSDRRHYGPGDKGILIKKPGDHTLWPHIPRVTIPFQAAMSHHTPSPWRRVLFTLLKKCGFGTRTDT